MEIMNWLVERSGDLLMEWKRSRAIVMPMDIQRLLRSFEQDYRYFYRRGMRSSYTDSPWLDILTLDALLTSGALIQ